MLQQHPDQIGQLLRISELLYRGHDFKQCIFQNVIFTVRDVLFTDEEWDSLTDIYLAEYHAACQAIPSNQNRVQIQHALVCGTLQKFTAKNISTLVGRFKKAGITPLILTPKLDGCGVRLYVYPTQHTFVSRGQIDMGFDITSKCASLVPITTIKRLQAFMVLNKLDLISVRGELICPQTVNIDGFASRRNFVSGQLNDQEQFHDVNFCCYEFVAFRTPPGKKACELVPMTYTKQLEHLHKFFSFKIPHAVVPIEDISVEKFNEVAALWKPNLPYDTDGVVVRSEHQSFENVKLPKLSVAFKFEQQTVPSIVTGHNWNVSKLNQLVPTVTFEPVKLDGKNITEASGFNLAYLVAQNLFVNKPCQVRLANSIIPQVVGPSSVETDGTVHGISAPQAIAPAPDDRLQTIALRAIMPEFCPMCKSSVMFDQVGLAFRCSTFRCQHLIFMQQAKKVFGLDNMGKVGLSKTYNTKGFNFQNWFVDLLRQRLATGRAATAQQIMQVFEPGVGESTKVQYGIEHVLQKLSMLGLDTIFKNIRGLVFVAPSAAQSKPVE